MSKFLKILSKQNLNFCSIYLMFLLWNFFYKIEKYLYFFIKKFIIKKKNQTFLKNIKLHTQKLLSQYKILNKIPKKIINYVFNQFFKKNFSQKKLKILIYISKYKISLYTKFSFYTQRIQNQPNLHDHGVVSLLNNFDSLNYFGSWKKSWLFFFP